MIEEVVRTGVAQCAVEVPDYAGVAVKTRCGAYVLDGRVGRGQVTCPDCRPSAERTARALPDAEDEE
jgi:hypothetical protein